MSNEVILGLIGLLTVAGGILSGAVAKMWIWFTAELKECKTERKELYSLTSEMNGKLGEVTTKVSYLENQIGNKNE